ncbi:MAG: polysaccharide pyruvyl transferase family protein [Floccifex sp.]
MNYGIITYSKRPMKQDIVSNLNIGDPIQTYAMLNVYKKMGIDENKIIKISRYHSRFYDGKEVVLPYNCWNMIFNQQGHPYGSLPLPPQIHPVFLSFHLHSRNIEQNILDNLKKHEPIGCRDEETLENMKRHGIKAWLSGCVTALLPKRSKQPAKKKVFFIDVPKNLLPHIPKDILECGEFLQHQLPFSHNKNQDFMPDEVYNAFYDTAITRILQYRDEASLVVTSRLHAATPCMAMGIPVIVAGERFDGRFSFLDRYLQFYTPEQFENIDWNPNPVEYEKEKEMILQGFIEQINNPYTITSNIIQIDNFYRKRNREIYNKDLSDMIASLPFSSNKNIKFGIWGINSKSLRLKNYLADYRKDWKFEIVIDKSVTGFFEGIPISKIEDLNHSDKEIIIFVIPEGAQHIADQVLGEQGYSYVLVKDTKMEAHMAVL